jgi:hypothetical protein
MTEEPEKNCQKNPSTNSLDSKNGRRYIKGRRKKAKLEYAWLRLGEDMDMN